MNTKGYKGDLSRYMPMKGTFKFIHIDVDGKGGIAKIIDDEKSFSQNQALLMLAEGALGHTMFSIRQSKPRDQVLSLVRVVREELKSVI